MDSLTLHPKSTILFLVALLNLGWVFYIVFVKNNFKNPIYKAYLFYSLCAIAWVITNAYFQSYFLSNLGSEFAKFMALIANISVPLSATGFYYISCYVKNARVSRASWIFMIFVVVETLALNLIPGLTVKQVIIFEDGTFQLIQGAWTGVFFLIGVFTVILSFINFIQAIKKNMPRIENIRVFYILFGMTLLYTSVVIFLVILPFYFENYKFSWIPPLMSLADVLLVGYAIVTQRFIDIRTFISRFFKVLTAFFIAILIGYFAISKLSTIYNNIDIRYLQLIGIALMLFIFNRIAAILNSRAFYSYFGGTDAEHIKYITDELKNKTKVYTSIEEYEKEIRYSFSKKLRHIDPQLIVVEENLKKQIPKLTQYFQKNRRILVTEEVKYVEKDQKKMLHFLEELESLGGICMPIFHPSKGLVALFTLGPKTYGHLYTKEEIMALENLGSFLNNIIISIIYNSELKDEVDKKTKELKDKIIQINELLQQQSDFIAVTAHEFRTPLSIATFQLEDILSSKDDLNKKIEELKVVEDSIHSLKQLTEKLFTIQQYDLNKVNLSLSKVELTQYLKKVYQEFIPIMKEKNLSFDLKIEPTKEIFVKIDPLQIRQVLHNLLKNASKFTSSHGRVSLALTQQAGDVVISVNDNGEGIPDELKKSIFEKFRTKSSGAGIGLGLYLCKKTIELHKGEIWVEDAVGGGASFRIKLKIME